MNWAKLITDLLPVAVAVVDAVDDAIEAGKSPVWITDEIVDHVSRLPGLIRAQ